MPARDALEAWLDRGRPVLAARRTATGGASGTARSTSASASASDGTERALFLGDRGGRLGTRSAYRVVARLLQDLPGEGPSGPHTFRHTAATSQLFAAPASP